MRFSISVIAFAGCLTLTYCENSYPARHIANLDLYLDESQPIEIRVEDALSRLTVEEKVAMVHAQSKFSSPGVPRLGIPEVWCTDGPHGVRPEVLWDEWEQAGWTSDSCTAFPALSCLGATWDTELARLYGESIGEEAKYRGKDVLLGPGVNICRTPLNGRTFEYFGEDPYASAQMVVPYVQGVQSKGVAACVKHFAANNQETRRNFTNSIVDDRTMYEIYLPAFKAAVDGGAWAIMGSYNMYNGQYNCHNDALLNGVLKSDWGFDGVVISDWGGTRNTEEAIFNGLDMEFGTWTDGLSSGKSNAYDNYYLAKPYLDKIRSGEVGTTELDDKVRRILRLIFRTSMSPEHPIGKFVCPEHSAVARKIGNEGIVLLKNEGSVLPLDLNAARKVLVVGENAVKMMTVGGGSSSLKAKYEITPLEGLRARLEGIAEVAWERGYVGDPTGEYNGVTTGQDLSESRSAAQLTADAAAAAAAADYVIFIGGLNKSDGQDAEGADRTRLELPYAQEAVILALAEVNPKLVVVNISGSPVAMPWADKVPAIVQSWYIGSEAGNSLADVLSGDVNPSGKLPFTVPYSLADGPLRSGRQYPGIAREGEFVWDEWYEEGIYIGYRWYDSQNLPVQFPFGFGLSYTNFEYSDATVSASKMKGKPVKVKVRVKNSGAVAGAEVVQLYISDPDCSVDRPVKELKGFSKVYLEAGEEAEVSFSIGKEALSYFDAEAHEWVAEPGTYQVLIGSSSRDIRSSAEFELL